MLAAVALCSTGFQVSAVARHVAVPQAAHRLAFMAEGEETAQAAPTGPQKREAYFCNDDGCWVGEAYFCDDTGCWVEEPAPIELPDGRAFSLAGVEAHSDAKVREATKPKKKAPIGIFAPAVVGVANVMGRKELNKLRAEVIAQHGKVISKFVDTSSSPFGQIVLKRMFEAADKDGNGTLDKDEVREALHALGFKFIDDKTLNKVMDRADADGNQVIDFEEFVNETPKTLRSSLIKLAKQNGHDLGFLA